MPDVFSPKKRSEIMRAVGSSGTKAERAVVAFLKKTIRPKMILNSPLLPGCPDIVIPAYHTVIMVHGCFWHNHNCTRGRRVPKTNQAYWIQKITLNKRRDLRIAGHLRSMGWRVFTVWECQLTPRKIDQSLNRLVSRLKNRKLHK